MNALLASRLGESKHLKVVSDRDIKAALGLERQKQLLGPCTDTSCLAEVSGALGARYLVTGRLDKLGKTYVLTTSVYDSSRGVAVSKPRAEASSDDGLPGAAARVAQEMLGVLEEAAEPASGVKAQGLGISLGLKFGNQFLASLAALNPGAELEVGWAFDPEWLAFLQVGFNLVHGQSKDNAVDLTVVPSVLGVRKLYGVADAFQPYWGLGMGLTLSMGKYGPFRETGSIPTVIGMFGFQYRFLPGLEGLVEASINIAQIVLGLSDQETGLGAGLNFDLSLGALYRF